MGRYTKKDAIRIVNLCANKYRDNLVNRSLLFVCMDKHKKITTVEFTFDANNFLHLTGLKLKNRKRYDKGAEKQGAIHGASTAKEISALDFYKKCLDHKLREKDFDFAEDGTTEMKLDVLPSLLTSNLAAKMIGDFQSDKPRLYTEKLAGGTTACMGFVLNDKTNHYFPNTVLKENIKKQTSGQVRVIACFRKRKNELQYSEITYLAKNIDCEMIACPTGYEYLKNLQLAHE